MKYRLIAYNYVLPENTYFIKYKLSDAIYLVSDDIEISGSDVICLGLLDALSWNYQFILPLEIINFLLSKSINAEIFDLTDEDIMYMRLMDWIS